MFGLGLATKIYVAVEAVDMRNGFEGLYGSKRPANPGGEDGGNGQERRFERFSRLV